MNITTCVGTFNNITIEFGRIFFIPQLCDSWYIQNFLIKVLLMDESTHQNWSISTSGAEIIRLSAVISEYVNSIKNFTLSEIAVLLENNPEDLYGAQSDISNMFLHVNCIGSILSCSIGNIDTIAASAESKKSCTITSGENQYLIEPTDLIYTEIGPLRKLHRTYMITRYDILNPLVAITGYEALLRSKHIKKSSNAECWIRLQNALVSAKLKISNTVSLLRPVFDPSILLCKRRELFESSFSQLLQSELF